MSNEEVSPVKLHVIVPEFTNLTLSPLITECVYGGHWLNPLTKKDLKCFVRKYEKCWITV